MRTVKNESQKQASKRINPLHMLLRLQNKELNYLEPRINTNAKKGGGREASPFSVQAHGSVPSTGQRRPGLPRAGPAVLSARWGLASGFGTGPGVPPMLWPLTGGRRPPYLRCPGVSSTCPGGRMAHRRGPTRGHPRARTAQALGPAGREVRFRKSSGD